MTRIEAAEFARTEVKSLSSFCPGETTSHFCRGVLTTPTPARPSRALPSPSDSDGLEHALRRSRESSPVSPLIQGPATALYN